MKKYRGKTHDSSDGNYKEKGDLGSSIKKSNRGFKRVTSLNPIVTQDMATLERGSDDNLPLTYVEITGSSEPESERRCDVMALPTAAHASASLHYGPGTSVEGFSDPAPGLIHVRTYIQTRVRDTTKRALSNGG